MHEVYMPEHSQLYTASRRYRQGNLKTGPSFCKHKGTGVRDGGGGRRRMVFPQSNTDIVMVYTACQMLLLVMLMLS